MRSTNIGSVSERTMRHEDLIPNFLWELEHQKKIEPDHRALIREIRASMEANGYFDSEDAGYDLDALFDALDRYSPPYFYFGANPGDGASYGWWLSEFFEEDFEGLRVSDLSEIPKGHTGEVLHINDHGNMSLYNVTRGRCRKVWGIV